ncbi:MAG: hypothetical protein AAF378_25030, partial [Cyanobacteria bacterium P01_A01_bin.84]
DFQTDTNQSKFYKIKHTLYQSTKIVPAAIIALSSFGIIAPSTLASLKTETEAQSRSIECCLSSHRSQILANKGVKEEVIRVAVEEGTEIVIKLTRCLVETEIEDLVYSSTVVCFILNMGQTETAHIILWLAIPI